MIQLRDVTDTLNNGESKNEKILIKFIAETMKSEFHLPIKSIKDQNKNI